MNLNNCKFEVIEGLPNEVTTFLNSLRSVCNNITVYHSSLRGPNLLMIVQLDFKGTYSSKEYEEKFVAWTISLDNSPGQFSLDNN